MSEFGECVDGFQYLFGSPTTFDEAEAFCISAGGRMTVPKSIDWLNSYTDLLINATIVATWVGLKDFDDRGGDSATRFLDIEGRPNPFTIEAGEIPWQEGEPNDINTNENCVIFSATSQGLNDVICDIGLSVGCERLCEEPSQDNFVFEGCVDGVELFFNRNIQKYDAANLECQSIDINAHLAIPVDAEFFSRMQAFQQSIPDRQTATLIGLRDYAEKEDDEATSRLLTVKGELLEFYNVVPGIFPWASGQPENRNGNQKCVAMVSDETLLLEDRNCIQDLESLCQRPCDGSIPATTRQPSLFPTESQIVSTQNPTVNRFPFIETSDCIDNFEYFFGDQMVTFDEATNICRSIGGRLTIPRSIDWLETILAQRAGSIDCMWIGLRDFDDVGGSLNADRFLDIEGRPNPFTKNADQFPWGNDQPDDDESDENCVELRRDTGGINDFICDGTLQFGCERYCGEVPDNFVFEECVDNVELFFNPNKRRFDAANADCEAFDPNGHLAIPTNNASLFRMQSFLKLIPERNSDVYIGLRDFANVGGDSTSRFLTLQGELLSFYNVSVGEFPWQEGQPSNADDKENCASVKNTDSQLLEDEDCLTSLQSLCQRPCTVTPTEKPTISNQEPDVSDVASDKSSNGLPISFGIFATVLVVAFIITSYIVIMKKGKNEVRRRRSVQKPEDFVSSLL